MTVAAAVRVLSLLLLVNDSRSGMRNVQRLASNIIRKSSGIADRRCPIVIDVRTQLEWDAGHASCAHRLEIQDNPSLEAKVLALAKGDRTHPLQVY